MNQEQLKELVRAFGRIAPAFHRWRAELIERASASNGVSQDVEWQQQIDSWCRTLCKVSLDEGKEVIRRMEEGLCSVPPYGEFAQAIRRESLLARQKASHPIDGYRTYECAKCRDTGIVEVWNPWFVEAYREQFELITRREINRDGNKFNLDRYDPDRTIVAYEIDPPSWVSDARSWWRSRSESEANPMYHVALCDCNCAATQTLQEELDKFNRGNRRSPDGKQASLPACGAAKYDRNLMPVKTADSYGDLHGWYAKERTQA